jgi:hypothetical protein
MVIGALEGLAPLHLFGFDGTAEDAAVQKISGMVDAGPNFKSFDAGSPIVSSLKEHPD